MDTSLPVLGAALAVAEIPNRIDWLSSAARDLEIQDPFDVMKLDSGEWRAVAAEAARMLAGYPGRIGIHGPFEGLTIMTRDPRLQQLVSDRLMQGLEFAAAVRATHMVVHSPWNAFGTAFVPLSPYYDINAQIDTTRRVFERPLAQAKQIGCELVIENIRDIHPAPWLALIDAFDAGVVRASIDVGHAEIMRQAGGPPADAYVRAAGNRLAHVHLQDTDGNTDRHWAPGDGQINFFALFEALGKLTSKPRLILELHDKNRIPNAVRYLSGLGVAR